MQNWDPRVLRAVALVLVLLRTHASPARVVEFPVD